MKKILKYTLPAACILALTAACSEKIDPVIDPDGPEIRFSVEQAEAGTKGLINPTTPASGTTPAVPGLAVQGTQLHVVDILSGFTGTVTGHSPAADGAVRYIDGTLQYTSSTAGQKDETLWQFVDAGAPAYYRWTKKGTHKFFGWLVKDNTTSASPLTAAGFFGSEPTLTETTSGTTVTRTLSVPAVTFTKDSPQFDFMYSDIVSRNAETGPYTYIPLNMNHLFTALAVEVSNQTGEAISDLSVKFTNFQNGRSATIDYSGEGSATGVAVTPTLTDGTKGEYVFGGDVTSLTAPEATTPVAETFVSLYNSPNEYRLLWQQDDLTDSSIKVAYTITYYTYAEDDETHENPIPNTVTNTATVSLKDLFKVSVTDPDTQETTQIPMMQAGHKYLLQVTVKLTELRFAVIVDPLVNVNATSSGEVFYFES